MNILLFILGISILLVMFRDAIEIIIFVLLAFVIPFFVLLYAIKRLKQNNKSVPVHHTTPTRTLTQTSLDDLPDPIFFDASEMPCEEPSATLVPAPPQEVAASSLQAWENLSDYVVIDIETTGLSPNTDAITELAAVRVRNQKISYFFQSLVNPQRNLKPFIIDLTGITDEMLKDAPLMDSVIPDFLRFVGTDIVVGHNVGFDLSFINENCKRLHTTEILNDYIDTMDVSRFVLSKKIRRHRLKDLKQFFSVPSSTSHRALADAEATYNCYEALKHYHAHHKMLFNPSYDKPKIRDIKPRTTEFDTSSPIYGKRFVFTRQLSNMTRREAMQLVVDNGGRVGNSVGIKTDYLVVGEPYPGFPKETNSQVKASELVSTGVKIQIISQYDFYGMLHTSSNIQAW